MGKICVECEDPSWTGQDPLVAPELPTDGGGVKVVDELPEKGQKGMAYVLVDDLDNPTTSQGIFVYDEGWLLTAQPVSEAVQKVEELPEEGQPGVLYYVPKTGDDTYDLYRWIDDNWIKVDTDIKLYGSTGQNTDGAMTQKAVTDALEKRMIIGEQTPDTSTPGELGQLYRDTSTSGVYVLRSIDEDEETGDPLYNWQALADENELLDIYTQIEESKGQANVLTSDDYNYPDDNPTAIEIAQLEPGIYKIDSDTLVNYHIGNGTSSARKATFIVGTVGSGNLSSSKWIIYTDNSSKLSVKFPNSSATYDLLDSSKVVNNLTSTSQTAPLSAAQGKVLKDSIGDIEAALNAINNGGNS